MKKLLTIICLTLLSIIGVNLNANATVRTATTTGNWTTPGTWDCSCIPAPTDSITIADGVTVTVDADSSCAYLLLTTPTLSGNTVIFINSGVTLTVNGDIDINGDGAFAITFIGFLGTASLTVNGDINFNTVSTSKASVNMGSGASILSLTGNMIQNPAGTFTTSSGGSTVNFNGAGAQTLDIPTDFVFEHLTFNNSGAGVTLGSAVTDGNVTGDICVLSGIFDNGGFAMTEASGDSLKIRAAGTFNLSGTSTWPTGFNDTITTGSLVAYTGGAQTVGAPSQAYSNITFSGGTTKTLGADIDVDGILTIDGGTTLDASAANKFDIRLAGNWSNSGVFNGQGDTVTFDGTTNILGVAPSTFSGVRITGILVAPAGDTLKIADAMISNGTFTHNGGIVSFNGITTITGPNDLTFNQLHISGTLTGPLNDTINIESHWTNTGTFTHNSGIVNLITAATKTITNTSGETFNTWAITGSGDITLANNVTVADTLKMLGGNISTGVNTLTLGTSPANEGELSWTTGTIAGKFERWMNSTSKDFIFPIGTVGSTFPANVNCTAISGGSLVAEFTGTDPGNNGLPIGDGVGDTIPDQYTEGFWDFVPLNGLTSTDYNLDLVATGFSSFPLSDSTRILKRASAVSPWANTGWGSHSAGDPDTVRRVALNGFGQFGIGNDCTKPGSTTILGPNTVCTGDIDTFTVATPTSSFFWIVNGGVILTDLGDSVRVQWNSPPGNASANVRVVETNTCGEKGDTAIFNVIVHTLPTSAIGGDATPFIGTSRNYTVLNNTGYSYTFSLFGTLGTVNTPCCDSTSTITWGGTAGNDTIKVVATAGGCIGDSVTLPVVVSSSFVSFQNGDWNDVNSWIGPPAAPPTGADSVSIASGHTITVTTTTDSCSAVSLNPVGSNNSIIVINTASTLNVGGNVDMNSNNASGSNVIISVNGTGILNITGDLNFNETSNATGSRIFMNDGGASTLNLGGDLNLNTLGTILSSANTLVMNGSIAQTLSIGSAIVLNHVTFANTGAGVTLGGAVTDANVIGNITVQSGIFNDGGFAMAESSGDNLLVSNGATFQVTNATYPAGFADVLGGASTVEYNSTAAQTIDGSMTYGNLDLVAASASTKTLDANIDIDGDLTIGVNATLDAGLVPFNIMLAGDWVNNGAYNHNSNLVTFDGVDSIQGSTSTIFNDVTTSGTLAAPTSGNMTMDGNLIISSGTFTGASSTDTVKVGGNWTNTGTFTHNSSTVKFFGGAQLITGSPAFNNVEIKSSSTLTGPSGTMTVSGNWRNNGAYTHNGGTVTFNGNTTIGGTNTSVFNNINSSNILNGPATGINMEAAGNINISAGTFTGPADTLAIAGNWSNSGAYVHNNGAIGFDGVAAQFITGGTDFNSMGIVSGASVIAPSAGMTIAGTFFSDGTFTHNGGTVTFNGVSSIAGASETTFNNVTVNTGDTLAGPATGTDMIIAGVLTIDATATFTGAADTTKVEGNWINTGSFVHNSGGVQFAGGTQAITGTPAFNAIEILASSTLTAPVAMTVAGDWVNDGIFAHNSGTVDFNGTSIISGAATNAFNNLTISGALTGPASATVTVNGNWNNSGTFTHNNSTIDFIGASAKGITNTTGGAFGGLTNSGSGTLSLTGHSTVANTLTLGSGDISTGTDTLTLGTSTSNEGTLVYTAGIVIGNFERWINTASVNFVFPVGVIGTYRPATVRCLVQTGGSLVATFNASDPGNNGLPIGDGLNDTINSQYMEGFWGLAAANAFTSTDYSLDLAATGFTSYMINDSTRILKRANAVSPWANTGWGAHVTAVPDTVKRANLNGFGQFGLGNDCTKPIGTTILGNASFCTSDIDTFRVETPTSTFSWVVNGGVILNNFGDSIRVQWDAPSASVTNVKVVETNACGGAGDTSTFNVTVHTLPTSAISQDATPFVNTTRTYTVLNNTDYSYTFSLRVGLGAVSTPCCDTTTTITWGAVSGLDTIRVIADSGVCAKDTVLLPISLNGVVISNGTGGGNWDAAATWISGSVPLATDSVNIDDQDVVTVNADSTCAELNLITATGFSSNTKLIVGSGQTFTVTGEVYVQGNGTLSSVFELNGTGTATIGGDINLNSTGTDAIIDMGSGASILNLGGSIIQGPSGRMLNSGTQSLVNFNGSVAQTMNLGSNIAYENVSFGNSGPGVTLSANISSGNVTGDLVINSGTVNTGGFDIVFDGNWENSGTVVFTAGDSVVMTGAGPDTIKGSSTTSFENLRIVKSSNGVRLESSATINSSLTLDGGAVTSPGGNIITLASSSSGTAFLAEVTGSGTIDSLIVQRHFNNVPDDWRLLGPAVAGTDLEDWNGEIVMSGFTGTEDPASTFYSVYNYNETHTGVVDSGFTVPASTGVGLSTGTGYMMWVGQALNSNFTNTIDLRGTPKIGTQIITATNTSGVPTPDDDVDGWNLVANPFPSDIEWDNVALSGSMTPFAYLLNPSTQSYSAIQSGDTESIPSMQGFWVKSSGSSGTVTIEEQDKSTSDGNNFLKMQSNSDPELTVTYTSSGRAEDVDIKFEQGATESYDTFYDAFKLGSVNWQFSNFSSVSTDSTDLMRNSLPELNQSYSVPLKISWGYPSFMSGALINGTINASDLSGLPASACVILEDLDSATFTNLRTSSYTFDIPDSLTRPRFMLHIGAPITSESFDAACNGATDGLAVAGGHGTGPWNYLWLNSIGDTVQNTMGINTNDTLSGIAAGEYTVHITSSGGMCLTMSDTVQISEPSALGSSIATTQDASCFGLNDGSVDVDVMGGTLPYAYLWGTGDTTEDLSNIVAGTYDLDVTDANGCIVSVSTTITEPTALAATGAVTDLSCFGIDDGSIDLTPGGGTAPYNYSWSNSDTSEDLSSIGPDSYTVDITDAMGCTSTNSFTVTEPAALTTSVASAVGISCFGLSDGSVDVDVTGGTMPYAYSWSSGDTTEDLSSMAAGIYDLDITDANSCVTSLSVTMTEPSMLIASGSSTDVTCNGDGDGAVNINVNGGTLPYGFTWSNAATTEDISGLGVGSYSAQIVDGNGCSLGSDTFSITEPIAVAAGFVAQKDTTYLSDGGEVQFSNTSSGASTFEWDFNDGSPVSTLMSPLHTFTAVGTYNVSMVAGNSNTCKDTAYKATVVLDAPFVGVEQLDGNLGSMLDFLTDENGIYIEFKFTELRKVSIQVFNVLGQEVALRHDVSVLNNKVKVLDPQKIMGVYLIKVETDLGSTTRKVIY